MELFQWLFADVTGLAVQLFFATTIIFMILDKQKPPMATAIPTGVALIVLGWGGSFSAAAVALFSMLNGVLWIVVGIQRYLQKKNPVV